MAQQVSIIYALWQQNRIRIVLLVVLLVLVVAAALVRQLVVEPHLQTLSSEQFNLQQHVRQRQVEFANSGIPVSIAAQLEMNLERFRGLIPSETDFSLFIGNLFDWAGQSQLEIDSISYQPEIDEETGYLRYGLNFSVKGSYARIKKFIHLLESSERILMIDKISLAGGRSQKGRGENVSLNIALTTYFRDETL